jgi:CHASE1-domain containing sensor protein
MRDVRPLLVAFLIVPGILVGIWIGTGSGQGTAPTRPPGDAVLQAQTPQAVQVTRPEQRKTPHDQQDPGKNAPAAAATDAQPDKGQGLGFDFARDPFKLTAQEKADLVAFMRQL